MSDAQIKTGEQVFSVVPHNEHAKAANQKLKPWVMAFWQLVALIVLALLAKVVFILQPQWGILLGQRIERFAGSAMGYLRLIYFYSACVGSAFFWLRLRRQLPPTQIAVSAEGFRLLRDGGVVGSGQILQMNWQSLSAIKLVRKGSGDEVISFLLRDGKEKHATIGRSVERTMWSGFFKSVHEHAPSVQLDRSLYRLLTQVRTSRLTAPALTTLPAPIEFDNVAPLPVRTSLKKGEYIIREQLTPSCGERAYTAMKLLRDGVDTGDSEDAHRKRLTFLLKEICLPVMLRKQQQESYIKSLHDEASDLQKINSGGIAKVEEFFVDNNRAFLVLESVRGISLRQKILSDGPMTEDEVRKLGFELGEIIACLQSCSPPVVHGRLTPDQIIFAESGAVKLADLPFSRLQRRRDDLAFTKALAYMSPECLTGIREQGSDIFSLGAILFFALTGGEPTPFGRLDVTAITKGRLEEVIATSSQPASSHRPSLEHLMDLLRD